jgi:hypothetical protein
MAVLLAKAQAQVVNLGDNLPIGQNVPGLTMSAWVKINSVDATERHFIHVSNNLATGQARLHISTAATTGKLRTSARRLDADGATTVESAMTPTIGVIYFFCVVARYNAGFLDMYVDGEMDTSTPVAGWNGNSSNTVALASNIGGRGLAGSAHTNTMDGVVADPRIYHRALTSTEVMAEFIARGRDRIIGQNRWPLMGVVGATVATARDKWIGAIHGTGEGTTDPVYTDRIVSHRATTNR